MKGIVGDLLFWGFMVAILVILIRDHSAAVSLMSGSIGAYTTGITNVANLGGPAQPG